MRIVGHRGAPAEVAENTLPSFVAAIEAGADEIETDVRATLDGELVLIHDDDVSRTTGGVGRISEMTRAAVRALDAGDGASVPTLDELLALDVPCVLEVKGRVVGGDYVSAAPVARAVVAAIGGRRSVTISSFDPAAIAEVRRLAPDVPTALGVLPGAPLDWVIEAALAGEHRGCHIPADRIVASFVARAHDAGLEVLVYTVNDIERARELEAMGVDGIFTDDPRRLVRALRKH